MALSHSPNIIKDGLVLILDAANIRSFRGEPTTNVFTHYGTPGYGAAGNVSVTFSNQGTGTFVRLGYGQIYGNYLIEQRDVVYRYDLGTSGCHYHGNTVAISSGQYATFTFDYYVSPETTIENSYLANFENYGGGAFGGSVSANGLKGVWQTATFTSGPASANGTLAMFLYPGGCSPSRFGNTGYILYKNPQVELRSTSTPFVNGTRGTTNATGGGWVDLSGNSNHCELVNSPTYNSNNGGSVVFDGTDDTVTTPVTLTTLAALSNWTMECWVLIPSFPTAASPNGYNNTTRAGVLLGAAYYSGCALYWYGNSSGNACTIYGYIRGNDGYRLTSGYSMSTNVWHHFVFVNSRSDTTIKLYVNGTLHSSVAGPTQEYNGSLTPTAGNIGFNKAQVDGGGENVYSLLNCRIGTSRIYTKALSATEVQQNFEATRARFGV